MTKAELEAQNKKYRDAIEKIKPLCKRTGLFRSINWWSARMGKIEDIIKEMEK